MTDLVERLRAYHSRIMSEAADKIERLEAELRSEREGKISQSYAAELARQVGELETENKRLREDLHRPIKRRRTKGDRFGISICWDDYQINGVQKSTNQVWRLIWMVKQLEKSYPDLYAHMSKVAAEMERLCDRDQRYTADDIEELRRDFPDLFTKVV